MRDGKRLHTTIYAPRDQSQKYPIMVKRTPYSNQPYGAERYPGRIGPSKYLEDSGFIFVLQDVRGRWMSEGQYDNMRPHVAGDANIDESSDTYDTIEWLLKNIKNHNGRVGMWGISYPGFYTAAALPEHHPALIAASPQAPISDFYFDDFHHQGAYLLSYFLATATFGYQHHGPTGSLWYRSVRPNRSVDAWDFYLNMVPVADAAGYYGNDNFFWQQLVEHPNYDKFWQQRSILPHLKNIKTNVMTVGGWFDAEDLYGPLNIYQNIERENPDTFNTLVMGPWSHGDWASRNAPQATVGNVAFGKNLSDFYQREIEAPFFLHFLKDQGARPKFEAMVYDTGSKQWQAFPAWPPKNAKKTKLHLRDDHSISKESPTTDHTKLEFISDPKNPVPYRARKDIKFSFTPRPYMTDDQRFASSRPDVMVFQTPPLSEPITFTGDILANLNVSTSGTDADWIVKLIDVYPDDYGQRNISPTGANLSGYQQMVRSEVMRGRFRENHSHPIPFQPGEVTTVKVPLQDVYHTFRPGHRIMVHVQSTWFPLIDRNPQTFVDNIFKARLEDYQAATHSLHLGNETGCWLEAILLNR